MKLYRPVLIESAEQAEALPEGAVAIHGGTGPYCHEVAIRDHDGEWWSAPGGIGQEEPAYKDDTIVGFTALVPIEAEEETSGWGFCTPACPRGDHDHADQTRLVTPWEEAQ